MQREHCETVAASEPKCLPAYVMFCTSLGILDFPHQECQLNRKRRKLRELSIHSKQLTMNNKANQLVLWIIHQFGIGTVHELSSCLFILVADMSSFHIYSFISVPATLWLSLLLYNHVNDLRYNVVLLVLTVITRV